MAAGNDMHSDVDGDTRAHEKSYSLFTQMMKWGTVISAVAAFVVILVIA